MDRCMLYSNSCVMELKLSLFQDSEKYMKMIRSDIAIEMLVDFKIDPSSLVLTFMHYYFIFQWSLYKDFIRAQTLPCFFPVKMKCYCFMLFSVIFPFMAKYADKLGVHFVPKETKAFFSRVSEWLMKMREADPDPVSYI